MAILSFLTYRLVFLLRTCYQVHWAKPVFHKVMLIGITRALIFTFFMDCIPYQPFP